MQARYAKASYVLRPLPQHFGPVRAFVGHLDVQIAIRGEGIPGPSASTGEAGHGGIQDPLLMWKCIKPF